MSKMDKNLDIQSALKLLDHYLVKKELVREFVIGGGAAVELLGSKRTGGTKDIDVVASKIDEELAKAAIHVAEKLGLAENWLNQNATIFNDRYPLGWEKRIVEVFKGTSLTVFSVGKKDLIFSKILSELDRGFDLDDIIALAPTKKELTWLEKEIPKAKSNTGHLFDQWEIDELFLKIRSGLGYDEND